MTLSDQELTLYALREAQLMVADAAEMAHNDPADVLRELRALLNRPDVIAAIERLEGSVGLRLA
jgi:hypothetical protein